MGPAALTAAPACWEGGELAFGVARVVALASWGYNTKVWFGVNAYSPTGPFSADAGLKSAHCCVLSFTLRTTQR